LACFKGTVTARVNTLQQQIQRIEVVSQPDNPQQVQKLNNLESQAWLYEGILERLGENPSANHEKIAKTLEALEYKRNEILQELEPRRPQKYRVLIGIQDSIRSALATQAEKDYIRLEKIVTNLVIFAESRQPSGTILSEVIERAALEIEQSASQISPYRLRLAYKIDDLLKILSAKLVLSSNASETDSSYQSIIKELRSRINLLSEQFNSLLRSRTENANELNKRIQDISNLTEKVWNLNRDVSERDFNIANLQNNIQNSTEANRRKESQINSLRNSIFSLQKANQSSTELDQKKQAEINDLQNQLFQLNQESIELQQRIQDIEEVAQNKQSQIEELQNDKSQLNNKKLELQQQYEALFQYYQQQENKIFNLEAQIKTLSQTSKLQPTNISNKAQEPPVRKIENKGQITVEEYEKILNQNDYEYVS
jgi:myosin heavy subunit